MSVYETAIVEPANLPAIERATFTEELYAAHNRIFSGVSRSEFARYVVNSPAEMTRIHVLRDTEGTIRGFRSGLSTAGDEPVETFLSEVREVIEAG